MFKRNPKPQTDCGEPGVTKQVRSKKKKSKKNEKGGFGRHSDESHW